MPTKSPFKENELVRMRKIPDKIGRVTGRVRETFVLFVQVKWSDGSNEFIPENGLEKVLESDSEDFESLVSAGRYGRLESIRSHMTYEKLKGELNSVLYSMQTAEIDYYPHQFLPVLKFVNSANDRLLIADEVGLGKTIEAGLIWTECRARENARRLLVVCKRTTLPKWIRELQDRFRIDAVGAMNAKVLLDEMHRLEKGGPAHSFAIVVTYEAIRPTTQERDMLTQAEQESVTFDDRQYRAKWLQKLMTWQESSYHFADLVVFDEAHWMKNTSSATHFAGKVLSENSRACIAMTATPVTIRTRDLYALMHLLDPNLFQDQRSFDAAIARNMPAVRLATALGRNPVVWDQCISLASQITPSIAQEHLLRDLVKWQAAGQPSPALKAELRIRAERLKELGTLMNRTRKAEVTENKVTRRPLILRVSMTNEEKLLYNGFLRAIRAKAAENHDGNATFLTIGPALSMTSCLPVAFERLVTGNHRISLEEVMEFNEDFGLDELLPQSDNILHEDTQLDTSSIAQLRYYDFTKNDSKYKALIGAIREHCQNEKVIIFAFFKGTLNYLRLRLQEDGFKCLTVTGAISDRDERDRVLQDFQKPENRILLCSEVAAEGVDLQFCRIVVNYDLPWNPMKVEQRIGRVDRLGQKADSIIIINFQVEDTIDGLVFEHLHRKIDIFRNSIGDLEGILGSQIQELSRDLMTQQLSPEEQATRIKQTEDAIANLIRMNAELDAEGESLVGLRDIIVSGVNNARTLGRYIKPLEIRRFTEEFFKECYSGSMVCSLHWDSPEPDCLTLQFSAAAFSDFESFLSLTHAQFPPSFDRNKRIVRLTFSSDRFEQIRHQHKSLIFVSHMHDFVRWMTSTRKAHVSSWHRACSAVLAREYCAFLHESGDYFFLCHHFTLKSPIRTRRDLVFRAVHLNTLTVLDPALSEELVDSVLSHGVSSGVTSHHPDASRAYQLAFDAISEDERRIHNDFYEETDLRRRSRIAHVNAYYGARINSARQRLNTIASRGNSTRGIRLAEDQIARNQAKLAEELAQLSGSVELDSSLTDLICGIVRIQ
jgi:SNF2 family DNA or RNA helicase